MLRQFGDMYTLLLRELRILLDTPNVYYKENGFLPGFHIFSSSFYFQFPVASFHTDGQQHQNDWSDNCDLNQSLSFTLSIDLPKNSSGLYIFDATNKQSRLQALFSNRSFIPYKIGKIVLHHGNNWHIMAPSKIKTNEYRMTLQGHGIKCQNSWFIYW